MTLSPIDARVFVSAVAAVLLILMVLLFSLSAALWVFGAAKRKVRGKGHVHEKPLPVLKEKLVSAKAAQVTPLPHKAAPAAAPPARPPAVKPQPEHGSWFGWLFGSPKKPAPAPEAKPVPAAKQVPMRPMPAPKPAPVAVPTPSPKPAPMRPMPVPEPKFAPVAALEPAPMKPMPAPTPAPVAAPAPSPAPRPSLFGWLHGPQKPSSIPIAAAPQGPPPLARLSIRSDSKDPNKFEIVDASSNAKYGSAALSPAWEGAALPSLMLSPNDTHMVLEARPLRSRAEGALCSILDPQGAEVGIVATLCMQAGWNSPPPKPVYIGGKVAATFRSIEVKAGLVSAALTDGSKNEIGTLQRSAPGAWEFRLLPGSDKIISRDAALLCAVQLIAEQVGR